MGPGYSASSTDLQCLVSVCWVEARQALQRAVQQHVWTAMAVLIGLGFNRTVYINVKVLLF